MVESKLTQKQYNQIAPNMALKHEVFQRNGFVLPNVGSQMWTAEYAEKVSADD